MTFASCPVAVKLLTISKYKREHSDVIHAEVAWIVAEPKPERGAAAGGLSDELDIGPPNGRNINAVEQSGAIPGDGEFIWAVAVRAVEPDGNQIGFAGDGWKI